MTTLHGQADFRENNQISVFQCCAAFFYFTILLPPIAKKFFMLPYIFPSCCEIGRKMKTCGKGRTAPQKQKSALKGRPFFLCRSP